MYEPGYELSKTYTFAILHLSLLPKIEWEIRKYHVLKCTTYNMKSELFFESEIFYNSVCLYTVNWENEMTDKISQFIIYRNWNKVFKFFWMWKEIIRNLRMNNLPINQNSNIKYSLSLNNNDSYKIPTFSWKLIEIKF